MEFSGFYLSIIAEAAGLILLVLLGYILLLKRDKTNLTSYVSHLKEKVIILTKKIREHNAQDNHFTELLVETIEYIKTTYEKTFGHEMGGSDTSIKEANSRDHFLFVVGYQGLKANLTALENSNTAKRTWEKFSSQMRPLIENYRIMPETQFENLLEEKVKQEFVLQAKHETKKAFTRQEEQKSEKVGVEQARSELEILSTHSDHEKDKASDEFINERKNEIKRLKSQIASQYEEIFKLHNVTSKNISKSSDPKVVKLINSFESIGRQLQDAQSCITMMEEDIATSEKEIQSLNDQLEQANFKIAAMPPSSSILTEKIKKKDSIIVRLERESKEMLSLIDGMEKSAVEQSQYIKKLEEQLNS